MRTRRKKRPNHDLTAKRPQARSRVSNGRDILPDTDGRSIIARRYRDVASQLVVDAGGLERCSEARLQLIRRFAAVSVIAEHLEARLARGESFDVHEHTQLASTAVRLASRIGVDRRAKNITPSLQEYVASKRNPRTIEHER